MKWIARFLVLIVIVVLLSPLACILPADLLIALSVGWAFYLYRVIPEIQVSRSGVATAVVCLVGFAVGFAPVPALAA